MDLKVLHLTAEADKHMHIRSLWASRHRLLMCM